MADNVNVCCGCVYQHNKTKQKNSELNVHSLQNLKIHLTFLIEIVLCITNLFAETENMY